jgi:hypothetical protein
MYAEISPVTEIFCDHCHEEMDQDWRETFDRAMDRVQEQYKYHKIPASEKLAVYAKKKTFLTLKEWKDMEIKHCEHSGVEIMDEKPRGIEIFQHNGDGEHEYWDFEPAGAIAKAIITDVKPIAKEPPKVEYDFAFHWQGKDFYTRRESLK